MHDFFALEILAIRTTAGVTVTPVTQTIIAIQTLIGTFLSHSLKSFGYLKIKYSHLFRTLNFNLIIWKSRSNLIPYRDRNHSGILEHF